MNDASVIGLFCDDVREERSGTVTIVGVYPDNLALKQVPGVFPKMCVYVRIHLRTDFRPGKIITRVVMPNGEVVNSDEADPQVVNNALEKARQAGSPYAGLIAKFAMVNLHVTNLGRMQALVSIGDKEYIAGALNLKLPDTAQPHV
jgi:hypothetical protein